MQRTLSGSIAITKINHYIMNIRGKDGKKVKCIVIPVEPENPEKPNYLVKGKEDSYYMNVRVVVRDEADQYNQHGFIAHSVDSKTYKEATDEQKERFKDLKILGNLRDFEAAPANDGNMGTMNYEPAPDDDGSDLPF